MCRRFHTRLSAGAGSNTSPGPRSSRGIVRVSLTACGGRIISSSAASLTTCHPSASAHHLPEPQRRGGRRPSCTSARSLHHSQLDLLRRGDGGNARLHRCTQPVVSASCTPRLTPEATLPSADHRLGPRMVGREVSDGRRAARLPGATRTPYSWSCALGLHDLRQSRLVLVPLSTWPIRPGLARLGRDPRACSAHAPRHPSDGVPHFYNEQRPGPSSRTGDPTGSDQRHRDGRGLPRRDRRDDQVFRRRRHRRGHHREGGP